MRTHTRLALMVIAGLTAGCRDAPDPFVAAGREPPSGTVWRLTFNPGDDRAPAWSPDGARIFYSAEGFENRIGEPGLLSSVPLEGGVAQIVFPDIQVDTGTTRWFTAPSLASGPDRVAFAHVIRVFDETLCGVPLVIDCGTEQFDTLPQPRLGIVAIRVRQPGQSADLIADPSQEIFFAGRVFDGTPQPNGLPGVWMIDHHPFHQLFLQDSTLIFRPSWSPDGNRLVISDGLQLRIWDVGGGTVTPIVGTADGIMPAWSPGGEWIAFTRLERADSIVSFCEHFLDSPNGPLLSCAEQRRSYTIGRRVLTLVRADGSELRELGEGEEAAWAPDGQRLYFRLDGRIWMRGLDPAEPATPVPDTERGREPAVAPDGRHLAFTRRGDDDRYSIWVARLEP